MGKSERYMPWLASTWRQAGLSRDLFACRQFATCMTSGRACSQYLWTSGEQAALSSGVPCGNGIGGNGNGGGGNCARAGATDDMSTVTRINLRNIVGLSCQVVSVERGRDRVMPRP